MYGSTVSAVRCHDDVIVQIEHQAEGAALECSNIAGLVWADQIELCIWEGGGYDAHGAIDMATDDVTAIETGLDVVGVA